MKTDKAVSVIVEKDKTISDLEDIIINIFKEKYGVDLFITIDFTFYYPEIMLTASNDDLPSLFSVCFDADDNNVYIDSNLDNSRINDKINLEDFKEKYIEFLESAPMKRLMSLYLGYSNGY